MRPIPQTSSERIEVVQSPPDKKKDWKREVILGAKKSDLKKVKSFMRMEQLVQVSRKLATEERRPDLARFAAVTYHYQLRVQSEGLPLQRGRPDRADETGWHSYAETDQASAKIFWRELKNQDRISSQSRICACA